MELRQLTYLVTVVEEASFTRAAARLHVAQPGVSSQIRLLEKELGEALLDRSGRTVRPTPVGAAVLPYARAALEAVAGIRARVDELTGMVRGHVTVGTVASPASLDLPGLLAAFHTRHPDVDITLREGTSDQLVDELRAGRLDLVLVGAPDVPHPDVATQLVADEALVVAVGPDGPLAGRDALTVAELEDRPLISMPRGSGVRSCLEQACAQAGFPPHVALEAGDTRTLVRLAARGLGLAVLPESSARLYAEAVRVLPLHGVTTRARILLAWRTGGTPGPAARALVRTARELLPDPAAGRPSRRSGRTARHPSP
ncbi:LysR family transcriptional regulator [Streptomyces gamaensis]|uniref:LysR family transcriptional regulator n=1 Tax=Streptomyces gamaensis TaxID=1763542 RepID=A0ABW0Z211_9ACTN